MTRRVAVVLVLAFCFAASASACPVCVGDTESQMAQGTNNAVLFLLAIVAVVQLGCVALILSIRRRTKELQERPGQLQWIEGGTR